MTLHVMVLTCWTALAPLRFVRPANSGTDRFYCVVSSTGLCQSYPDRKGGALSYLVYLLIINLGAVVLSNVQAYRAL
jgi:hypothetical protein